MRPKITKRLNSPNVKLINYKDYKGEKIYDEVTEEYFNDIGELEDYYDNYTVSLPYPQYANGKEKIPTEIIFNLMKGLGFPKKFFYQIKWERV
nr:MAG TPA: hypothetical protein [Caudoviricetes sp.]